MITNPNWICFNLQSSIHF